MIKNAKYSAKDIVALLDSQTLQMKGNHLPITLKDLPETDERVIKANIDWFKGKSQILCNIPYKRIRSALVKKYKTASKKKIIAQDSVEEKNASTTIPVEIVEESEEVEAGDISLKQALSQIESTFKKYIDTSEENISLLAHWVLGTYFHAQFETFPIGQLLAQKQSGKTRTLKLCSMLCKDGDGSLSASLTETHLFRRKNKPAFFDEMESINNRETGNLRELVEGKTQVRLKFNIYNNISTNTTIPTISTISTISTENSKDKEINKEFNPEEAFK